MLTNSFIRGYFYPRPPCGGRLPDRKPPSTPSHFYPRPPCGGRPFSMSIVYIVIIFLSTSPLRGTTLTAAAIISITSFLSTSPLRGTTAFAESLAGISTISIHVPLAGDDILCRIRRTTLLNISIHVPLAGDDMKLLKALGMVCVFLSTSPLRGTTVTQSYEIYFNGISIHVPLAGDDVPSASVVTVRCHFYPRPPCGGRRRRKFFSRSSRNFYPRPPCGGRHDRDAGSGQPGRISIHVPLAGDDLHARGGDGGTTRFLSTSPLRGTTFCWPPCSHLTPDFYPRPPCGGRLRHTYTAISFYPISIHVPLAGDDVGDFDGCASVSGFLSTSPLRGTTFSPVWHGRRQRFLSTSPLRGTTCDRAYQGSISWRFLSTSPLRGTTWRAAQKIAEAWISIHVPLAGDDEVGRTGVAVV